MAFIGALVYLFFIAQYGLNGALDNFNKFVMDDTLKGYICFDEKIVFDITNGKSVCALRCSMDLACSSIIYYPDTGKCIGCTSFTGVNDPLQNNSVFYKRGFQYLGCYDDRPRILIEYNVQKSSSQSTENCVTRCRNQDASFSVTEYATECWCGTSVNFTIAEKVSESECSWSCSGNTSQKCGAASIGSLYRTGV
ncbi:uncharacterized protein LOC132738991 [Ruditapes philippinarum]|uniref:uncharacterized protein LOC132738991 n=1 Tax=Ruditapes philippinarum TaxID=129788 RepID=UPI00295C2D54|nr:uncharacterized protein LOC132738991 [Ruditapes philippinarum]